ncbi:hypothetical protein [Lacimicrobium alkaliphilum]|uniref:DNA repair ATPase n=1 Tax=Lacimicrobium alkaliphilum TaxID=1526571 RepID=A0ABQ1R2P3_9ALTE|nr:hypothetical protein [Lacimicrobium alkaliphilum]GGD54045.1 DNA repair ATPase [Lacimicrobium alkaliphilum]
MFTIVIVLIVALIIIAIIINAIQQHREQVEAERRAELAKQKAIVDETEDALMAAAHIPVSQHMILILNKRILNGLKEMQEHNPKARDLKQRIKDAEERVKSIDTNQPAPGNENFSLPDNDKQIIVLIQGIKKLRTILRSENSKGKVDSQIFLTEDKRMARLQLKINVETLVKRGRSAIKSEMLGSARQYFEKAIAALNASSEQDDYTIARKQELEQNLESIQNNLRNANAEDRARKKEEERDELDELFAPKKKW